MPELPEVQTTVSGLQSVLPNKTITDVWTDWPKMFRGETLSRFKKSVVGNKIRLAERRGKHVLIHLSGNVTIIIHMKMTGHLLYGNWKLEGGRWKPKDKKGPLNDPFNRFIHVVFILSNG